MDGKTHRGRARTMVRRRRPVNPYAAATHGGAQQCYPQRVTAIPASIVTDLAEATHREWLVTNGLGGYASGTISGIATRRYHGLLVSSLAPPRGRHVMASHLDETVCYRGMVTPLGAHRFGSGFVSDGWQRIESFAVDPFPTWRLRAGDVVIERAVSMQRGRNTTLVRYTTLAAPGAHTLVVRPFLACRPFHEHTHANTSANLHAREIASGIVLRPYATLPPVTITAPGIFRADGAWWHDFAHAAETLRGLDDREDLWTPGEFIVALAPGESVYVLLSTEEQLPSDPAGCVSDEATRILALVPTASDPALASTEAMLLRSVDAYRAACAIPPALIAGYPWFEDWGRDTLISFVGAYLVTGQWSAGRDLLEAFARYIDQGLVPNRFPDSGGGGDYNTVDAPLWYFHAARRYVQYTNDVDTLRAVLYPACCAIATGLRGGAPYGIRVGADGLLTAGDADTQLTWMDARVDGRPVTSRHGRAVEINALWHAALLTLAWMAERLGDGSNAASSRDHARRTRDSFREQFWNESQGYLYDIVRDDGADASLRPNALYAVALPGEILPLAQAASVVAIARKKLLVPLAVRTLAPDDARYVPAYRGDPTSRDRAYHMGTAWPFLVGVYATAVVRVAERNGDPTVVCAARQEVAELLHPLTNALTAGCVGHLSEVVDGNPPYRPGGCFAQAWSDCEALRALSEDALARGPLDRL